MTEHPAAAPAAVRDDLELASWICDHSGDLFVGLILARRRDLAESLCAVLGVGLGAIRAAAQRELARRGW